jgi:hypothetical protein
LGWASLLVLGVALAFWKNGPTRDPPPEVYLTGPAEGKTLVAVYAGLGGVYLILPDGSLWRWGDTGRTNRAVMPVRIGTNRDWSMVSAGVRQRLGVRRDGTLWEWEEDGAPSQVGADKDWVEAAAGAGGYKVARKEDGTLWLWGQSAGSATIRLPALVGTNRDWTAVQASWSGITAVRSDGTLWGSGDFFSTSGGSTAKYSFPTQLCAETNWLGIDRTFGFPALRNKDGELWALPGTSVTFPSPATSISAISQLLVRVYPAGPPAHPGALPGVIRQAQRADQRNDWVAVANSQCVAFGLTADGTLWTWGWKIGENPKVQSQSRLAAAMYLARVALGKAGPSGITSMRAPPTYGLQEKPRALMKLVPEPAK